jgi:hypothetical protein
MVCTTLLGLAVYGTLLATPPSDDDTTTDDHATADDDEGPADWETQTEAQMKLSRAKLRKRDEYIESALDACENEEFDTCATHASFALRIDPDDVSAKRLREVALYVGGSDLTKGFRPRIGSPDEARFVQLGVLAIPYNRWHGGYLVTADFMGVLLRGKTTYSVAVGPHAGVFKLRYRHPEYLELSKYRESFAGGLRLTFRLGRSFPISWHGYFDIYGQFSLGFTGVASSPMPKRKIFGHLIPGIGVSYSLGRMTWALAMIGSFPTIFHPKSEWQAFSLGVMPSFAVGF